MKRARGFTLVELLISTAIIAVVLATVYSAFRTGLFGWRSISERAAGAESGRQIFSRIDTDLRNAFAYSAQDCRFQGGPSALSFLSLTDTFSGEKGLPHYSFLLYEFKAGKLTRLCRQDKDSFNPDSQAKAQEFTAQVRDFSFAYGYLAPEEAALQWKDAWEDPKTMPLAVKIKIFLISGTYSQGFEHIVYLKHV